MLTFLLAFSIFTNVPMDSIQSLEELKWKNRIVLYFPKEEDQKLMMTDSLHVEIKDRKIAYFLIQDCQVESNLLHAFSNQYIKQLESRYRMGSKNNCWVLIGLDGGVKIKRESELDWNHIFKLIDAMPMRNSERRNISKF